MDGDLQPTVLHRYDSGLELRVASTVLPRERDDLVTIPQVIRANKLRPHIRILGSGLFMLVAQNYRPVSEKKCVSLESWGVNWAGMERLDREDYRMVFADDTIVNPRAGIVWVGAAFAGFLQIAVPPGWRPLLTGLRER